MESSVRPSGPEEELERVERALRGQPSVGGLTAGDAYLLVARPWHEAWLRWVGQAEASHGPSPADYFRDAHESLFEEGAEPPSARFDGPTMSASKQPGRWLLPAQGYRRRVDPMEAALFGERPGPLDNSSLMAANKALRPGLSEGDFVPVSCAVWSLLQGWYGGGPELRRTAAEDSTGYVALDLYGLQLIVYRYRGGAWREVSKLHDYRHSTVADVKARICKELQLPRSIIRLWAARSDLSSPGTGGGESLEGRGSESIGTCGLLPGAMLLLQEPGPDGAFALEPPAFSLESAQVEPDPSLKPARIDETTTGRPVQVGAAGLKNLGNTCFLNSSVQCLGSVPRLRDYFVSGSYAEELPKAETKGQLARSFGELLQLLSREDVSTVAPRSFKLQVGQLAEQFNGYRQHDSMEFMEYVLDGLKEDLNKVWGKKTNVETCKASASSEAATASDALRSYRQRNDSFIDSLFVGFFKSTLVCPEADCAHRSVTFDPFLSVKLPLAGQVGCPACGGKGTTEDGWKCQVCWGTGEGSNDDGGRVQDLRQCMQSFTTPERLSKDDAWKCQHCQRHVEATKHLQFYQLPPVLLVQLKRFAVQGYSRKRLDTPVRFPLHNLDLAACCVPSAPSLEGETRYSLCAVSKHIGSLGGGHYVAYGRSALDGAWYHFDDGVVKGVDESQVLEETVGAYLLVYLRQDDLPESWVLPVWTPRSDEEAFQPVPTSDAPEAPRAVFEAVAQPPMVMAPPTPMQVRPAPLAQPPVEEGACGCCAPSWQHLSSAVRGNGDKGFAK